MKVLIFGATGMVGQGVLIECLRDPGVEAVVAIGRNPVANRAAKLQELLLPDPGDLRARVAALPGSMPASSASASRPPE